MKAFLCALISSVVSLVVRVSSTNHRGAVVLVEMRKKPKREREREKMVTKHASKEKCN